MSQKIGRILEESTPTIVPSIDLILLLVGVILAQIGVITGQIVPAALFLVPMIFCSRKLTLLTGLLVTIGGAVTMPLLQSQAPPQVRLVKGRVIEVPSRRQPGLVELLLQERSSGRCFLLRLPDLPWREWGEVRRGSEIEGLFRIDYLPRPGFLELFSYSTTLLRRGIVGIAQAVEIYQVRSPPPNSYEQAVQRWSESYATTEAIGVILAATIADDNLIGAALWDLFRATGTTHLVVVSGFHVGLLYLAMTFISGALVRRYSSLLVRYRLATLSGIGGLIASLVFMVIIGEVITAQRAVIMLCYFVLGTILGRRGQSARTLILTAVALFLIWPGSFLDVGTQLSFAALIGLDMGRKLVEPITCGEFDELRKGTEGAQWRGLIMKHLIAPLSNCCCVALTTNVLLLIWFRSVVLGAPLINLVLIPVFSAVTIGFGGVALALSYINVAEWPLALAVGATEQVICCLKYINKTISGCALGYWKLNGYGVASMIVLHLAAIGLIAETIRRRSYRLPIGHSA